MIGIYKITNKINNKNYIGQSINIEKRWSDHISPRPSSKKNSAIQNAIQKYGVNNFDFSIIEECPPKELNEREQYWIKYYDSFKNGYNLTLGGDGVQHYDIQEILEDYQRTQSMQKTAKNFDCHENTIRNILHTQGIYKTDCQLEKIIEKIDPNTLEVIAVYSSVQEAADNAGVSISAMSQAINGTVKSSGGYFWRVQGEEKDFSNIKVKKVKRKIQQIDLSDHKTVIAEFDQITDALRALGKNPKAGGISQVCKGKQKSAFGFFWKYAD